MLKVLIVDDSIFARELAREALTGSGLQVVVAENGAVALERLDEDVVCVLCDINMPVMDGLEFLEALGDLPGPVPPVLVITTESELGKIQRARALGALGWMLKPLDQALLLRTVHKLVERHRGSARCGS